MRELLKNFLETIENNNNETEILSLFENNVVKKKNKLVFVLILQLFFLV